MARVHAPHMNNNNIAPNTTENSQYRIQSENKMKKIII